MQQIQIDQQSEPEKESKKDEPLALFRMMAHQPSWIGLFSHSYIALVSVSLYRLFPLFSLTHRKYKYTCVSFFSVCASGSVVCLFVHSYPVCLKQCYAFASSTNSPHFFTSFCLPIAHLCALLWSRLFFYITRSRADLSLTPLNYVSSA